MRAKLVTFGITAVATLVLVVQASSQAIAQGNANKKPAAAKKKTPPPPPPPKAAPAPAADPGQTMMAAKPKPKPKRKVQAVPKGIPGCIKQLTQLAAKDPLIDYDGRPSDIVNGGLLWSDEKSRCSVAADEAKKKRVLDLAAAWRRKDAAQVRSLLQELAQ